MAATKVFPLPVSITAIVFSLSAFSYISSWYDRGMSSGSSCAFGVSTPGDDVGDTSRVCNIGVGIMSGICSCAVGGMGRLEVVLAGFKGGTFGRRDIGPLLTGGVITDKGFSRIEWTGSRTKSGLLGSSFLGGMGTTGIDGAAGVGAGVGWRIGAVRAGMGSSHRR
jgi:hypothetical protein